MIDRTIPIKIFPIILLRKYNTRHHDKKSVYLVNSVNSFRRFYVTIRRVNRSVINNLFYRENKMDRRSFLKSVGVTAAGTAVAAHSDSLAASPPAQGSALQFPGVPTRDRLSPS